MTPVEIALALAGTGVYQLGTGDSDTPMGDPSDCAGFAICKCHALRRHRPGFNRGSWASVSDDINCNSAIEDADHKRELFERVALPEPGDLLTYPSFISGGKHFIGHVAIITHVPLGWKPGDHWGDLTVVQCCGPNGHRPGIVRTDASHWDAHDRTWPLPQHRTALLRVKAAPKGAPAP